MVTNLLRDSRIGEPLCQVDPLSFLDHVQGGELDERERASEGRFRCFALGFKDVQRAFDLILRKQFAGLWKTATSRVGKKSNCVLVQGIRRT